MEEFITENVTTEKYLIQDAFKESFDVFNFFLDCMEFPDPDEPLTQEELKNPNSKITCFVSYLMSMEPPFYADLNNACLK